MADTTKRQMGTVISGVPAEIALHPPGNRILIEFDHMDAIGICYYRYVGIEETPPEPRRKLVRIDSSETEEGQDSLP